MVTPPKLVAALFVLLALALSACDGTETASASSTAADPPNGPAATPNPAACSYDFGRLLPSDWQVVNKLGFGPLNLDDKTDDFFCVVLYRFEIPRPGSPNMVPVGAIIFRRDRNRPMDIHAYPLSVPGRMFLGEHQINVAEMDALSGPDFPGLELVLGDVDEHGLTVEASIFRWSEDPKSENSGYLNLGFFQGDGGIKVSTDRVAVRTRRLGTRSQLADRRTYILRNKSYYKADKVTLVDPLTIDLVSLTMLPDPPTSEYPEKVVLGFYEYLSDRAKIQSMLSPGAWNAFQAHDRRAFGCTADDRNETYVQNVDYQPKDAVPAHVDNKGEPVTARVVATIVCLRDGRVVDHNNVTWPVKWEKDSDRWVLQKPSDD